MEFTREQEELIEKYRDINIDRNWWVDTEEEWVGRLAEKGIDAEDFAFTGFYSQGDGASFCGFIDIEKFLKAHNMEDEYRVVVFFARRRDLVFQISRMSNRHHAHEHTVGLSVSDHTYNDFDPDDVRYSVHEVMAQEYVNLSSDFEEKVMDICRSLMREYYAELRAEYESLCSDEAVWDTIVANDLHVVEVD